MVQRCGRGSSGDNDYIDLQQFVYCCCLWRLMCATDPDISTQRGVQWRSTVVSIGNSNIFFTAFRFSLSCVCEDLLCLYYWPRFVVTADLAMGQEGCIHTAQTRATATAARHATASRQDFRGIFPVCELKATPHSFTWLGSGSRWRVWKR